MSIKSRVWVNIVAVSTLLVGITAHAATSNTGSGSSLINIGALGGLGFISKNGGTQLVIGANGDYKLWPELSVGGYFTYNSLGATPPAKMSLMNLLAEINYYLSGQLDGFRIGGKLGASWTRTDSTPDVANSQSNSDSHLAWGLHGGYDYPIGMSVTLGGEANAIFITGDTGPTAFNFLANLKYWF